MKVCIVGAGAIGGWIGVHLGMQPDVELSVLARGQTLRNIQQSGLQLTQNNHTHRVDVVVSDDTQQLGSQDLVVIAVKAPAACGLSKPCSPIRTREPNWVLLSRSSRSPA